ncbi:MAG: YkgJ family cysteine cluster protein [Candidatus Thorarchaeota archaeon]
MTPFVCNHDGSCSDLRLCCSETEMTLTKRDVRRLEAVGHDRNDFLVRSKDGFCELRNIDGLCYFYDPNTRECKVYEMRPEGCRYYPIVYDARKRKCVVDKDCPSRETVTREEIRKVCHKVRALVETLQREAAFGERPC